MLTEQEYSAERKAQKAKLQEWFPETDGNMPRGKRASEVYAYFILDDQPDEFPDGRVLLMKRAATNGGGDKSEHEQLLNGEKLLWFGRTSYQEYQDKVNRGYTVLPMGCVRELGSVEFDQDGKRYAATRMRLLDRDPKSDTHRRRKDIKLVFALIKKRQRAAALQKVRLFDAEEKKNGAKFLVVLDHAYDIEHRKILTVPAQMSVADLIKTKEIDAVCIAGMGRAERENGQWNMTELIQVGPYQNRSYEKEVQTHLAAEQKVKQAGLDRQTIAR